MRTDRGAAISWGGEGLWPDTTPQAVTPAPSPRQTPSIPPPPVDIQTPAKTLPYPLGGR